MKLLAYLLVAWVAGALGFFIAVLFTAGRIAQYQAKVARLEDEMKVERIRGWMDTLQQP